MCLLRALLIRSLVATGLLAATLAACAHDRPDRDDDNERRHRPRTLSVKIIGLDFNSVGNHDFDKGSAEFLRLQHGGGKITNGAQDPSSCQGALVGTPTPFEGAKFKWLSANVVATASGQTLLPPVGTSHCAACAWPSSA
jgi:hypothetical protein